MRSESPSPEISAFPPLFAACPPAGIVVVVPTTVASAGLKISTTYFDVAVGLVQVSGTPIDAVSSATVVAVIAKLLPASNDAEGTPLVAPLATWTTKVACAVWLGYAAMATAMVWFPTLSPRALYIAVAAVGCVTPFSVHRNVVCVLLCPVISARNNTDVADVPGHMVTSCGDRIETVGRSVAAKFETTTRAFQSFSSALAGSCAAYRENVLDFSAIVVLPKVTLESTSVASIRVLSSHTHALFDPRDATEVLSKIELHTVAVVGVAGKSSCIRSLEPPLVGVMEVIRGAAMTYVKSASAGKLGFITSVIWSESENRMGTAWSVSSTGSDVSRCTMHVYTFAFL
jgi:hypothetical protein